MGTLRFMFLDKTDNFGFNSAPTSCMLYLELWGFILGDAELRSANKGKEYIK